MRWTKTTKINSNCTKVSENMVTVKETYTHKVCFVFCANSHTFGYTRKVTTSWFNPIDVLEFIDLRNIFTLIQLIRLYTTANPWPLSTNCLSFYLFPMSVCRIWHMCGKSTDTTLKLLMNGKNVFAHKLRIFPFFVIVCCFQILTIIC